MRNNQPTKEGKRLQLIRFMASEEEEDDAGSVSIIRSARFFSCYSQFSSLFFALKVAAIVPSLQAHVIFTHQDHPRMRQEHSDQLGNSWLSCSLWLNRQSSRRRPVFGTAHVPYWALEVWFLTGFNFLNRRPPTQSKAGTHVLRHIQC